MVATVKTIHGRTFAEWLTLAGFKYPERDDDINLAIWFAAWKAGEGPVLWEAQYSSVLRGAE
jgi:hypothetical protein